MKLLSESKGITIANQLKADYAAEIRESFEHKAKSCAACATPGACCLDAHFVNVHITRLEAVAIRNVLDELPAGKREEIYERVGEAVVKYGLSDEGDTFEQKFACPLFEKGIGCLIHDQGKPLPCIQHACYENLQDLPPDELMECRVAAVERLNRRCYAEPARWLPLPVWLSRLRCPVVKRRRKPDREGGLERV